MAALPVSLFCSVNSYFSAQTAGQGADPGERPVRHSCSGIVTDVQEARKTKARTQTIEILDFGSDHYEYLEHLYDRIPTLPQSLYHDFGILAHLWQNIAHRVARTAK